jgi:hypothetical protein
MDAEIDVDVALTALTPAVTVTQFVVVVCRIRLFRPAALCISIRIIWSIAHVFVVVFKIIPVRQGPCTIGVTIYIWDRSVLKLV